MQLLVVERSPGSAVLAAALLDDAAPGAFAVEGVPFGDPALDRLSGEGIDCVLVDLGAPDAGRPGGARPRPHRLRCRCRSSS
jgi:DNA-binding response OmpR family regulator